MQLQQKFCNLLSGRERQRVHYYVFFSHVVTSREFCKYVLFATWVCMFWCRLSVHLNIFLYIYIYNKFCKREIYHCHYVISVYHSNELSSVCSFQERNLCIVRHQWDSSLLFQCIVCVLWVLIIFYVGMWSVVYRETVYDWFTVCECDPWKWCWRLPRRMIRWHEALKRCAVENKGN
jgi:hypothetical protein